MVPTHSLNTFAQHVRSTRLLNTIAQQVRSTRLLASSDQSTSVRSPSRSTLKSSPHHLPVRSTCSTCLLPYPRSIDLPLSPTYANHSTRCGLSSSSLLRPPPSHSPASISAASPFPPFLHPLPSRHSFFRLRPYRSRTYSSSSLHVSPPLFCSFPYPTSI